MSRKVGNLFQAISTNLLDMATALDTGYRIPEYQRPYDWSEVNVKRLYTDCLRGFYRMGQGPDTGAYCFLGSLILVHEKSKEATFSGHSVAVIDGQQRLTTLSLMACALHSELSTLNISNLDNVDKKVTKWLTQERENLLIDLSRIALGGIQKRGGSISFFPKIVRESYNDNRAVELSESEYNSPISKFLNQFAVSCQVEETFIAPILPATRSGEQVKNNFLKLREYIESINNDEAYDDYDATIVPSEYFQRSQYRALFTSIHDYFTDDADLNKVVSSLDKDEGLIHTTRYILFCNYFLSNVILTTITAEDEALAFDMFDSLNTTGEPLTALETLKPLVISFENGKPKNYKKSLSKEYFDEMANVLDRPDLTTTQKQNLTRDAIINVALVTAGEKLGRETSEQRTKLRSHFDKAVGDSDKSARLYVKQIRDVVLFRAAYWQSDYEKLSEFHPAASVDEVRFLVSIIAGLKTHLALPILQRYWSPDMKHENQTEFLEIARAVVAYLLLRRAFTGTTAGIDSELRKLMSKDLKATKTDTSAYLMTGVDEQYRKPTSDELRAGLKTNLKTGSYRFSDKGTWVKKVARNPLYGASAILCKAIHLFAADGSLPDTKNSGHWVRKGLKVNAQLKRANYSTWILENHSTVEHVAPRNMAKKGDWDEGIYKIPGLIDSLGNLTLLPTNLNSGIGNASWVRKSKFFSAIACEKDDDQKQLFKEAKADGMEFKKKFVELINSGEHLPLVVPISLVENWEAEQITQRSENIASLAYDKLVQWLG